MLQAVSQRNMELDQHILGLYTTKESEVKHKDKRRDAFLYLNNLKWRKAGCKSYIIFTIIIKRTIFVNEKNNGRDIKNWKETKRRQHNESRVICWSGCGWNEVWGE